jgi:hypothetical protein
MARHGRRPAADGAMLPLSQLTGMSRDDLIDLWRQYYKAEPPARLRRPLLELAVGWAIQAEEQGGLSPAAARQLQGSGHGQRRSRRRMKPGARLVREWHGAVHVVEAKERGFVWQDRSYASLSAIAREITGANWSGPRFFGLTGSTKS